ncbi:MAG: SnoaL-like polyketide cyclase [Methanomassiliicoccales archaeon PtaU1.Bin124]|nr:MAG: SnoaL-like polyketide cyclase [Methanomassiliicoccales archaeon PtaU1.Bin124]
MDMSVEENLSMMKQLDDAWNARDWKKAMKFHSKDVAVYWPGGNPPTMGRDDHEAEAIEFTKAFPDNKVWNNPYRVQFGQGDWTCTVTDFTGTMKGPMNMGGGKVAPPTNRSFKVDFCTVAHWKNGEIVDEKLFYDLIGMLKQIGLM